MMTSELLDAHGFLTAPPPPAMPPSAPPPPPRPPGGAPEPSEFGGDSSFLDDGTTVASSTLDSIAAPPPPRGAPPTADITTETVYEESDEGDATGASPPRHTHPGQAPELVHMSVQTDDAGGRVMTVSGRRWGELSVVNDDEMVSGGGGVGAGVGTGGDDAAVAAPQFPLDRGPSLADANAAQAPYSHLTTGTQPSPLPPATPRDAADGGSGSNAPSGDDQTPSPTKKQHAGAKSSSKNKTKSNKHKRSKKKGKGSRKSRPGSRSSSRPSSRASSRPSSRVGSRKASPRRKGSPPPAIEAAPALKEAIAEAEGNDQPQQQQPVAAQPASDTNAEATAGDVGGENTTANAAVATSQKDAAAEPAPDASAEVSSVAELELGLHADALVDDAAGGDDTAVTEAAAAESAVAEPEHRVKGTGAQEEAEDDAVATQPAVEMEATPSTAAAPDQGADDAVPAPDTVQAPADAAAHEAAAAALASAAHSSETPSAADAQLAGSKDTVDEGGAPSRRPSARSHASGRERSGSQGSLGGPTDSAHLPDPDVVSVRAAVQSLTLHELQNVALGKPPQALLKLFGLVTNVTSTSSQQRCSAATDKPCCTHQICLLLGENPTLSRARTLFVEGSGKIFKQRLLAASAVDSPV